MTAGVGPGSTVYVAGAGPVGLAAAASARLLGAAVVIVGDVNPKRLVHAKAQGFEIADLSLDTPLHEQIAACAAITDCCWSVASNRQSFWLFSTLR
ncbi:Glutathione-independent formaldehyde dehydrogenase [Pseudomonas amygdali pv. aesculi]|nr:Glutathione-independent formaldehyde dehydrogenase [Pseudomonas amygdali pv. aesculi]